MTAMFGNTHLYLRDEEAVERRRAYCVAGVNWFAQLARRCALQFSLLYEPDAKVIASCRREHVALVWETLVKRESRWLENLCNMPFVQADAVVRPWGQYRLRRYCRRRVHRFGHGSRVASFWLNDCLAAGRWSRTGQTQHEIISVARRRNLPAGG